MDTPPHLRHQEDEDKLNAIQRRYEADRGPELDDDDDPKLSLDERIRRAEARRDWTAVMWLRERRGW